MEQPNRQGNEQPPLSYESLDILLEKRSVVKAERLDRASKKEPPCLKRIAIERASFPLETIPQLRL